MEQKTPTTGEHKEDQKEEGGKTKTKMAKGSEGNTHDRGGNSKQRKKPKGKVIWMRENNVWRKVDSGSTRRGTLINLLPEVTESIRRKTPIQNVIEHGESTSNDKEGGRRLNSKETPKWKMSIQGR